MAENRGGRSFILAVGPLLILPVLVFATLYERAAAWVFMWVLATSIYVGCKWLSYGGARSPQAPLARRLLYLFCWPGMDARAFLGDRGLTAARPRAMAFAFAAAKVALGLGLLYGVAPSIPAERPLIRGWTAMVGLIFVLHFGTFDLLSLALRSRGFTAHPLMSAPIAATSISAFWGKRWNTAFRDLTHRFLFRPLTVRFGARAALAIGFLMSGLVHELVISVPARGGFGGPTIFFVVQGLAMLLERSKAGRRVGLGSGPIGWIFTAGLLLSTAGLLFHRPFIENVMLPFFSAIGAMS